MKFFQLAFILVLGLALADGSCKDGEYAPNPENCGSFLQCVQGEYLPISCPSGLHWNEKKVVCDFSDNAKCDLAAGRQDEDEAIDEKHCGCECEHGDYAPNPDNCCSFLQCVWCKWATMPCPCGLHWNDRCNVCDWPDHARCEREAGRKYNLTVESRGMCKQGDYAPDPEDCSSFLRCVQGKYYPLSCPSGLHWNSKEQVCDIPEDAKCYSPVARKRNEAAEVKKGKNFVGGICRHGIKHVQCALCHKMGNK